MKLEELQKKDKQLAIERNQKIVTSQYIDELKLKGESDKAARIIKDLYASHPTDPIIKYYYGKLLRRSNLYKEALEVLSSLKEDLLMSKIEKIRCFLEVEDWENAIELCKNCYQEVTPEQTALIKFLDRAWVYAHKKIGKFPNMNRRLTYIESQIYHYSKDAAKEYIKNNHQFEEKDRVEELFMQVEEVLPTGKCIINASTLTDTYLYSYITATNTVGILKAITIHNTKDIILMYPVVKLKRNWGNMVQDDLLLLDHKEPEKRVTQVEKFKQKYKKFL